MLIKAEIDRFEEDKAVLVVDDGLGNWPRGLLPAGASEGDVLSLAITVDEQATRKAKTEAKELMRQLIDQNKTK
jgi:hypothetical protein